MEAILKGNTLTKKKRLLIRLKFWASSSRLLEQSISSMTDSGNMT